MRLCRRWAGSAGRQVGRLTWRPLRRTGRRARDVTATGSAWRGGGGGGGAARPPQLGHSAPPVAAAARRRAAPVALCACQCVSPCPSAGHLPATMGRRNQRYTAAEEEELPEVGPVMEILLWRDPKKSGAAFATGLVLLFSMLYCSFISVVAYFGLALLTVTLGFRLYKTVLGMVQKTNDGHPFQDLLSADPLSLMEILLWRDPKKSGAAFATGLVLLFSMLYCSFISVVAYFGLALLTVTLGFRLYKTVLGMVQKTNDGHPFQDLLSVDTTVTPEKGHELADKAVAELNCCTSSLKDLFLVKDIFESVKFGFVLYLLTYLGAWFNTMTLVIMGYVALFTLPKVYEQNKEKIDEVFGQVKDKVAEISAKVKAAIPMGKKAAEPVAEEKKEE
ncbi:Reticulon-3 [Amphibalanus amphitrite]|uniref:Reticulon-like protein n=1 Tax=Amphibalanus amphitrite TaxID=1232801 RepID=A0A6A4W5B6_AMPAM|nr:Reticulon-3 [Amphibalanus amphitrite]